MESTTRYWNLSNEELMELAENGIQVGGCLDPDVVRELVFRLEELTV